jgi:hypothetical protein
MGEVVDLEFYRKRLMREAVRGQGPGNRRSPEQGPQCAEPTSKKTGSRKSRASKSNQLESPDKPEIESNDSTSD